MFWVLIWRSSSYPKFYHTHSLCNFLSPGSCQTHLPGAVPAMPVTSFTNQSKCSGIELEELHPHPTGVTGRMKASGFHRVSVSA